MEWKTASPHETLDVAVSHEIQGDQLPDPSGNSRLSEHPKQVGPQAHLTPARIYRHGYLCPIVTWLAFVSGDADTMVEHIEGHQGEPPLIIDLDEVPQCGVIEHRTPAKKTQAERLTVSASDGRRQLRPIGRHDGANMNGTTITEADVNLEISWVSLGHLAAAGVARLRHG